MYTTYQNDLLNYLIAHRAVLVKWLTTYRPETEVLVDDFFEIAVDFLDVELNKEMLLYDMASERYRQLIDMLIELHIVKKPSGFCTRLSYEVALIFQSGNV